jgi:Pyruvate/2-oxoglutarate dehydrogenase complex, dihydrolipoamide dehydrogenase (E3) component, and related enzymes
MQERKNKVVKTFNSGVRSLMKTNKVTVFEGSAQLARREKFRSNRPAARHRRSRRRISSLRPAVRRWNCRSRNLTAKTIVCSTEALEFTEAPKKLVVIGAGAIGLELGSVWNRLGSEVTMLEFLPRIALGFDLELSNLLQRLLTAQGMTFHLEAKVSAVNCE